MPRMLTAFAILTAAFAAPGRADAANPAQVSVYASMLPAPSVAPAKLRTPPTPVTGAAVTYRLVVTNAGSATVMDVTMTDTVSPVITGVVADQPSGFIAPVVTQVTGGTRYVWSATGISLANGQSLTFTLTGQVGVVCGATTVTNVALITAANMVGEYKNLFTDGGFLVSPAPLTFAAAKLQVPASGSNVNVGTPVAYRIVVTNTGAATITSLAVVDTVSPIVTGVVPDQPAPFLGPAVTQVPGVGTRYEWSATGLNLFPGASVRFRMRVF